MPAGAAFACTIERFAFEKVLDTYAVNVFVETDWLVNVGVTV
jgi:hypothetical protein